MKFSLEQVELFGVTTGAGVGDTAGVGVTTGAGVGVTTGFDVITILRSSRFDSEYSELPG